MVLGLKKCPECGSKEFKTKGHIRGRVEMYHRFDGKPVDNSEYYDGTSVDYNKWVVCAECERKLFTHAEYLESRGY